MIFGNIEYLNLLPFHIFMKRFHRSSQERMSMNYYGGVPSKVNNLFTSKKVDAAFISSIKAKGYSNISLGIIAKKEVLSVIVIPNEKNIQDKASASSNALAKILNIDGEVIIGDKALKYQLGSKPYIDLAQEWNKRYNLPFVFALLCFHKDKKLYKKIQKQFLKQKVKIPSYILLKSSKQTEISQKDILNYLTYISYEVDIKAKRSLKLFYAKTI